MKHIKKIQVQGKDKAEAVELNTKTQAQPKRKTKSMKDQYGCTIEMI